MATRGSLLCPSRNPSPTPKSGPGCRHLAVVHLTLMPRNSRPPSASSLRSDGACISATEYVQRKGMEMRKFMVIPVAGLLVLGLAGPVAAGQTTSNSSGSVTLAQAWWDSFDEATGSETYGQASA